MAENNNHTPHFQCPECNGTGQCALDEKFTLILDEIKSFGGSATCAQIYDRLKNRKLFRLDKKGRVKKSSLFLMHHYIQDLQGMGLVKKGKKVKPNIRGKIRSAAWEFSLV